MILAVPDACYAPPFSCAMSCWGPALRVDSMRGGTSHLGARLTNRSDVTFAPLEKGWNVASALRDCNNLDKVRLPSIQDEIRTHWPEQHGK